MPGGLFGTRCRVAEVVVNHGLGRHHDLEGRSSAVLGFRDPAVARRGVCFDAVAAPAG